MIDKKKLNKKDFMFKGIIGEKLVKNPGQINGLDFVISKCKDCEI
jgi:protein XRP2